MATTTTMGRGTNDPQMRTRNTGLYWGIAAVAVIVIALLFSMRTTSRDTMAVPATTAPVTTTAPVESNSAVTPNDSLNGAATNGTMERRVETDTTTTPAPTDATQSN